MEAYGFNKILKLMQKSLVSFWWSDLLYIC